MSSCLSTFLARHARYRPHHLGVVVDDARLDFAAFHARVERLARGLGQLGLVPGDKVVTLMGNRLELLELYWAAAQSGLVLVPLSPLLRRQALQTLIEDADASVIFTETACAEVLDEVRPRVSAVPEGLYVLVDHDGRFGYLDLEALCARGAGHAAPRPEIAEDAPYNIIYSSGTTGLPKGIVLSHRTRAMYATLFASTFRMTPESVVMHSGSVVFNGAFLTLMPAMYLGARYILQRQFNPAAFVEAVRKERVTHVMMVPSQLVALLASPAFDPQALASLQMICSVGAPLLRAHKQALAEALPGRLHELYGLTEGFVTVLDRDDVATKLATVGTPPPGFELRVVRPDGRDCAAGEVGEILGRGPILMSGYHGRPDATAEAIVDGWLRTGDLGTLDEDGYLLLVDRKKDMFISGGVNVYPRDIEEVVARHPAVQEVAVFGVPDEAWGESAVAAVRLRHAEVDRERLREWVNDNVGAKYQRVRDIVVLEDFPRNATGKTLKRELREMVMAGAAASEAPASGRMIERDGVRLHYVRSGPRQKMPLVLLHGLTANAHFFGGLMGAGLDQRHDVLRIDLRGRGLSDKPVGPYSMQAHAADVLAVLDAAGIAEAIIVGHSFGALVTLWLAAHHPGRVRRQILMDMSGPTIHNPEVMRLLAPSLDRLDREEPSLAAFLLQMRGLAHLQGAWCDDLDRYYRADVEVRQDGVVVPRAPRRAIEQCLILGRDEDWGRIIARATPPALVLHANGGFGDDGTPPLILRSQAEELTSCLPDARLVGVPGNHVTMMFGDGAQAVVGAIDDFLGSTPEGVRALGLAPGAGARSRGMRPAG